MTLDTVECELWGWYCISNMEVKKDGGGGGGPWSSSGAPSAPAHPNCYRSTLVALFLFFVVIGVFVGLLIGESVDCIKTTANHIFYLYDGEWTTPPLSLPAYLVQEQHYFMETVELKGLKYDLALQDENAGFSIVLSSVLKSKVRPYTNHVEGQPIFAFQKVWNGTFSLSYRLKMSSLPHQYRITTLIAVLLPMGKWKMRERTEVNHLRWATNNIVCFSVFPVTSMVMCWQHSEWSLRCPGSNSILTALFRTCWEQGSAQQCTGNH